MGYNICDYHVVGEHSNWVKLLLVREDEKGFLSL